MTNRLSRDILQVYLKTAGVTPELYILFYLNFTGLLWKLNSGIAIVKKLFHYLATLPVLDWHYLQLLFPRYIKLPPWSGEWIADCCLYLFFPPTLETSKAFLLLIVIVKRSTIAEMESYFSPLWNVTNISKYTLICCCLHVNK